MYVSPPTCQINQMKSVVKSSWDMCHCKFLWKYEGDGYNQNEIKRNGSWNSFEFCTFFSLKFLECFNTIHNFWKSVSHLEAASWSGESGRKMFLRMWWSSPWCSRLTKSNSIWENCIIWIGCNLCKTAWTGGAAGEAKWFQGASQRHNVLN